MKDKVDKLKKQINTFSFSEHDGYPKMVYVEWLLGVIDKIFKEELKE